MSNPKNNNTKLSKNLNIPESELELLLLNIFYSSADVNSLKNNIRDFLGEEHVETGLKAIKEVLLEINPNLKTKKSNEVKLCEAKKEFEVFFRSIQLNKEQEIDSSIKDYEILKFKLIDLNKSSKKESTKLKEKFYDVITIESELKENFRKSLTEKKLENENINFVGNLNSFHYNCEKNINKLKSLTRIQSTSIKYCFDKIKGSESIVISAPTGSGKSLVAWFYILRRLLKDINVDGDDVDVYWDDGLFISIPKNLISTKFKENENEKFFFKLNPKNLKILDKTGKNKKTIKSPIIFIVPMKALVSQTIKDLQNNLNSIYKCFYCDCTLICDDTPKNIIKNINLPNRNMIPGTKCKKNNLGSHLPINLIIEPYTSDTLSIPNAHIIVCTPFKLEINTRCPERSLLNRCVKLCVVDEVHCIEEGGVERLLLRLSNSSNSHALNEKEKLKTEKIQIIALSATIANLKHLLQFLSIPYCLIFDNSYKTVPVDRSYIIYKSSNKNIGEFIQNRNSRDYERVNIIIEDIINFYFNACMNIKYNKDPSSKKGSNLNKDTNLRMLIFTNSVKNSISHSISLSNKFPHLVVKYHNSKLIKSEKLKVEKDFREGKIDILVCTMTLAFGVNLPANIVIVGDCRVWDSNAAILGNSNESSIAGGWRNMSEGEVMQCEGRCGRLGFVKKDSDMEFKSWSGIMCKELRNEYEVAFVDKRMDKKEKKEYIEKIRETNLKKIENINNDQISSYAHTYYILPNHLAATPHLKNILTQNLSLESTLNKFFLSFILSEISSLKTAQNILKLLENSWFFIRAKERPELYGFISEDFQNKHKNKDKSNNITSKGLFKVSEQEIRSQMLLRIENGIEKLLNLKAVECYFAEFESNKDDHIKSNVKDQKKEKDWKKDYKNLKFNKTFNITELKSLTLKSKYDKTTAKNNLNVYKANQNEKLQKYYRRTKLGDSCCYLEISCYSMFYLKCLDDIINQNIIKDKINKVKSIQLIILIETITQSFELTPQNLSIPKHLIENTNQNLNINIIPSVYKYLQIIKSSFIELLDESNCLNLLIKDVDGIYSLYMELKEVLRSYDLYVSDTNDTKKVLGKIKSKSNININDIEGKDEEIQISPQLYSLIFVLMSLVCDDTVLSLEVRWNCVRQLKRIIDGCLQANLFKSVFDKNVQLINNLKEAEDYYILKLNNSFGGNKMELRNKKMKVCKEFEVILKV